MNTTDRFIVISLLDMLRYCLSCLLSSRSFRGIKRCSILVRRKRPNHRRQRFSRSRIWDTHACFVEGKREAALNDGHERVKMMYESEPICQKPPWKGEEIVDPRRPHTYFAYSNLEIRLFKKYDSFYPTKVEVSQRFGNGSMISELDWHTEKENENYE